MVCPARRKTHPEHWNERKEGYVKDVERRDFFVESHRGSMETNVVCLGESLSLVTEVEKKSCCNRARKLSRGEYVRLTRFSVTYFITPLKSTLHIVFLSHSAIAFPSLPPMRSFSILRVREIELFSCGIAREIIVNLSAKTSPKERNDLGTLQINR